MMEWLEMGGRGQYVWPAYALTLAVVVLNVIWARGAFQEAREEARRRISTERNE
jgi:heme exporter protein CcmD